MPSNQNCLLSVSFRGKNHGYVVFNKTKMKFYFPIPEFSKPEKPCSDAWSKHAAKNALWAWLGYHKGEHSKLLTPVSQQFTGDLGLKSSSPSLSWRFPFHERNLLLVQNYRTGTHTVPLLAAGLEGMLSKTINRCLQWRFHSLAHRH